MEFYNESTYNKNIIYITLFTHILNEEELIENWINHHKQLVDHCVILDFGSTDNTINIIQKMCPTWEIKKPTEGFGYCVNDIHLLEQKYLGWKITLNITEFLLINDLKNFIKNFEIKYPEYVGFRTRGCVLVDKTDNEIYNLNEPILKQKHYGYFEEDTISLITPDCLGITSSNHIYNENEIIKKTAQFINIGIDGRSRLIHKSIIGEYTQGRHATTLNYIYPRSIGACPESELILVWLGYSPFEIYKNRLKRRSRDRYNHFDTTKLLNVQQSISHDLLLDKKYIECYNNLYNLNINL
jgi:hypothetical protein